MQRYAWNNCSLRQMIKNHIEHTSLMLVIAGSTQKEQVCQVSYLKAENVILRSYPPDRNSLTQREKNRLVRFAKYLGAALNELATIGHTVKI